MGNKVLFVDFSKDRKNTHSLIELLSKRGYHCHYLNHSSSLSDSVFTNSFDLVIMNLAKGELIHTNFGECKKILLVGKGEKHLLSYVKNTQAVINRDNIHELLKAILVIQNGGFYLSEEYRNDIMPEINLDSHVHQDIDLISVLTEMELKVVEELINDKTNQQIADTLYLSKRTVEYHIAASMQKLRVKSRVGLAVKITKANLICKFSGSTPAIQSIL